MTQIRNVARGDRLTASRWNELVNAINAQTQGDFVGSAEGGLDAIRFYYAGADKIVAGDFFEVTSFRVKSGITSVNKARLDVINNGIRVNAVKRDRYGEYLTFGYALTSAKSGRFGKCIIPNCYAALIDTSNAGGYAEASFSASEKSYTFKRSSNRAAEFKIAQILYEDTTEKIAYCVVLDNLSRFQGVYNGLNESIGESIFGRVAAGSNVEITENSQAGCLVFSATDTKGFTWRHAGSTAGQTVDDHVGIVQLSGALSGTLSGTTLTIKNTNTFSPTQFDVAASGMISIKSSVITKSDASFRTNASGDWTYATASNVKKIQFGYDLNDHSFKGKQSVDQDGNTFVWVTLGKKFVLKERSTYVSGALQVAVKNSDGTVSNKYIYIDEEEV